MPRKKLHDKNDVLRVIHESLVMRGSPPTIEELREALGVGSKRTILRYLQELEEAGMIERWSGARGLRPLRSKPGKGMTTVAVPLVGEAPAGPLMIAEQNIDGWVRMPSKWASNKTAKYFLLKVRGDSMNRASLDGDRIEDGDLILVRQQSTAQPGDIIVAVMDGEATVKRLVKGQRYWVLKPESTNPENKPVIVDGRLRVNGVVVRVIKKGVELLIEGE